MNIDSFAQREDFRLVEIALFYLVVWRERGRGYRVPSNGVVRSPGLVGKEDKGDFGSLGDTVTWLIRPTSSLLKRSCIFNKGGRTRRTPLSRLYTAARADNLNFNLPDVDGAILPWKFYVDSYLLNLKYRIPSVTEVVAFILLASRLTCNLFYHRQPNRKRLASIYQHNRLRRSRK